MIFAHCFAENEQEAGDPMVEDNHAGPWTHLVDSLREEINNALMRESVMPVSCKGRS